MPWLGLGMAKWPVGVGCAVWAGLVLPPPGHGAPVSDVGLVRPDWHLPPLPPLVPGWRYGVLLGLPTSAPLVHWMHVTTRTMS